MQFLYIGHLFFIFLYQSYAFFQTIYEMTLGISFISLVLLISGIIVITLSYVAWRKYKGQQKLKKVSNQIKKRSGS